MQFHFGDTDMMTEPDVINSLRNSIPDAETYIYDAETYIYPAGHSFANDATDTYVSDAALPALERSVSFLNTHHR